MECNDGNTCTTDGCADGGCVYVPIPGLSCDDGLICTTEDECNEVGECEERPSHALTMDNADLENVPPTDGCIFILQDGTPCDDDQLCTQSDACDEGTCKGVPIQCEEPLCQTSLGCSEESGECLYESKPNGFDCDDNSLCSLQDTCNDGKCIGLSTLVCNDGNACTLDECNPQVGCVSTPLTSPCDDLNECTVDLCEPMIGCVFTPQENIEFARMGSSAP